MGYRRYSSIILLLIFLLGCQVQDLSDGNLSDQDPPTSNIVLEETKPTMDDEAPVETPQSTSRTVAMVDDRVNRIGIRTVDGVGEFYDTHTDERFIPRGVNYVDFREVISGQIWEDYIFGAGTYQPDKVRQAFQHLSAGGYNTVRLFFDHCFSGPSCIGNHHGQGLNPTFLDNMVEVMRIAVEEGLYLILTANGVPLDGGYWTTYDQEFNQHDHFGFDEFYGNAYYLNSAGVDMQAAYWGDLMTGLADRNAPFSAVLGWQLQNEYWLFKNTPPFSLEEGMVTICNGQTYNMADPDQKRQMVADGVIYWMETLIPVIKSVDPEALVTVGFFPPDFPVESGLVTDWYRDTASIINTAPVDFWDFHAYPEPKSVTVRNMQSVVENFGMTDYDAKPIILGEYGVFRHIYPGLEVGTRRLQEWMAESCEFGFDGWLIWEYYNRPASDAVWGLENDFMFDALAPINHPDPCKIPLVSLPNLAFDRSVTASSWLPGEPPGNAVDGGESIWNAGADAPQWIEVDLGEPKTITSVHLWVAQEPSGETIHVVYARDISSVLVEITRFEGVTASGQMLTYEFPQPLEGMTAIRVVTIKSPSWVAWSEIEIYSD